MECLNFISKIGSQTCKHISFRTSLWYLSMCLYYIIKERLVVFGWGQMRSTFEFISMYIYVQYTYVPLVARPNDNHRMTRSC